MATFTTTSTTFTEVTPNCGMKEIIIITPSTGIASDTAVITLKDYGISTTGLLTVEGFTQTTASSIVVTEAPTTSVSAGVLTITSGAGTGTKIFRVLGRSGN